MLPTIQQATADFERWLTGFTPLVEHDLASKHEQMASRKSPFAFLRATFYRWAQVLPEICPQVCEAPIVLAIGDLHIENFGTWRDSEGRLVWGVNDHDEAFELPYTNDLVRLAVSALLAIDDHRLDITPAVACDAILAGYTKRIDPRDEPPTPFIIDERHRWAAPLLRERDPAEFWSNLRENLTSGQPAPTPAAIAALQRLLPKEATDITFGPRQAGVGSLGKPRFCALANWLGGPIAREAKALTPSACYWSAGQKPTTNYYDEVLRTAVRCPDPCLQIVGNWIVRRLAPDCNKIELKSAVETGDGERLLRAMGKEIVNVHSARPAGLDAIRKDLKHRPANWLHDAAKAMMEATVGDWDAWRQTAKGER